MSGLSGENRSGGGDVGRVGAKRGIESKVSNGMTRRAELLIGRRYSHLGGGSEVGGHSNVLDGRRESEETGDVGVGELVLASGGGGVSEGSLEERNVLGLVLSNLDHTSSDPGL